ncbi:glycosyltransferase [Vulcanisaeta thermophila]|uniref:glycosyltransferase n=1 Tax=Vulcanisaeta thermophila TaxID=867917 RepID=UPI000852D866|nr:glycosyltransferase family 2 protein [Vulcanisaeta thermophila]
MVITTVLMVLASLFIAASTATSTLSLYFEIKFWRGLRTRGDALGGRGYPSVTVIMPVRGVDQYMEGNVKSVLEQDYPGMVNYLFIFDSMEDPGYNVIKRLVNDKANVRILVLNGGGGKSLALSMGLRNVDTELVAFVDSDALVPRDWLRNLVNELLSNSSYGASTTYRFYVPLSNYSLGSILRSSFNMIGITAMQNPVARFTWGGSTVVWNWLIRKWNVPDYLPNYYSDDYVITHFVHKEGLKIAFVPKSMVITLEDTNLRGAFEWAVRQLWFVRVYGFRGFLLYLASYTLLATTLPLGLITALLTSTPWLALATLMPYIIGSIKDYYRVRSISGLSQFHQRYIGRRLPIYMGLASILNIYFSWIAILRTMTKRSITWRGRVFTEDGARARMRDKPLP